MTLIDQHADVAVYADELRAGAIVTTALNADLASSLEAQESWGALAASLRHAEDYGHDPVQTLKDAYKQRELGTADDVPALLHWRIEKALEGIGQPIVRVIDREPVDGVPAWIADGRHQDELLPAEWRDQLAERHHYIGVRLKERGAALALKQPAWSQDLGRLPSEPWRMFDWHRTAAEIDVLRTKYRIDPSEPQAIPDKLRGNPVADALQERVIALHKAAALSTAPEVTESTREHYAASAADRSAEARTTLLAAAECAQQAVSTVMDTASNVVAETRTDTAAEITPQSSTAEAAPVAPTGAETTPVASASPTTTQEGTIMSDPIDETFEHIGRHAGRAGQTIAGAVGRQMKRAADERRRALQEADRGAERDREFAARQAQQKAERQQEQAERDVKRQAEYEQRQAAQEAQREQERADRLAQRYPNRDADRQQDAAAAATTGAVLGAAAADTIDNATDCDAADIRKDGHDDAQAESATVATEETASEEREPAGERTAEGGSGDSPQYDEFELRDREMLRETGIDPDEVTTSSASDSSLTIVSSSASDLSRGDDGIER